MSHSVPSLIAALGRGYRVPIIDYERPGSGLLVSSGCGCMMAVMDAAPALRWCLDIDELGPGGRLDQFLLAAETKVSPIAVVGWFSITPPGPLRAALAGLTKLQEVICYVVGTELPAGVQCSSMEEFISRLRGQTPDSMQLGQ